MLKPQTWNKEVRIAIGLFLIAVLGFFIRYGLNVLLARHLGARYYGEFRVADSMLNVLIGVSLFGTNIGAQRFFAEYLFTDKHKAARYISWNFKLLSLTFVGTLIVGLFIFVLLFALHVLGIRPITHYHLVVYMFWVAPLAALASLIANFLFAQSIYLPTLYLRLIRYFISLLLFSGLILLFDVHLTSMRIVFIYFLIFSIMTITSMLMLTNEEFLIIKRGLKSLFTTHIKDEEGWLKVAQNFIRANLTYIIISVIDLFIVAIFIQNKAEVGYYAAVLTINGFIWIIPANLYQSIKFQVRTLLLEPGGKRKLQTKIYQVNAIVFLLLILIGGLIIFYASTLLAHFGNDFVVAKNVLIVWTIGSVVTGFIQFAIPLLLLTGWEKTVVRIQVVELTAIVVSLIPITYFYGILGTAITMATLHTLASLYSTIVLYKRTGIRAVC